jgi:tRNA-dihydrouridine synthase B
VRSVTDSWSLGGVTLANRLVLAPLAGIGNWFVRLQAKRYGAGLVVSEMVSSFGLAYGNERTVREFLRIHPDEHPVAVQLFGHDAAIMREAAAMVADAGADLVDLNMGCPVRKVCKTGAGASLLDEPDNAVAIATAAREGSGLPVTVKLRSGNRPGERTGFDLARRLEQEAGVAGIAFHPRHARNAFERTGADAVMLARGSLGNPWLFERLLGRRSTEPTRDEVAGELRWVIASAEDHLGIERAGRYLRKFYPWYSETMGLSKAQNQELCSAPTTAHARVVIDRFTGASETAAAA